VEVVNLLSSTTTIQTITIILNKTSKAVPQTVVEVLVIVVVVAALILVAAVGVTLEVQEEIMAADN
jgi:uncharacterized membrane protein